MEDYLYHYTSIETLLLILKNKTLALNSLLNVDDLEEKETEDIKNFGRFYYVSCWTDEADESIPMWSMYSKNMTGVRIKMKKYPFKIFKYKCGEYGFKEDAQGYINLEKLYEDNKGMVVINGLKLFQVAYTDNRKLLYPKIETISDNSRNYGVNKLGRCKNTSWSFQKEWRYGIFISPWGIEELKDTLNIQKYTFEELCIKQQLLVNRLKDEKVLPPYNRYYMELSDEALENMEILLSPKMTEAQEEIIKMIVDKYNPRAKIVKSKLKDKV